MSILKKPLFYHQELSLEKMRNLEQGQWFEYKEGRKGISKIGFLSDPVGSGKSLTVLYHVATDLDCKNIKPIKNETIEKITYGSFPLGFDIMDSNIQKKYPDNKYKLIINNLLILPHTLVKQWKTYIHEFIPSLASNTFFIDSKKALEMFQKQYCNDIEYKFVVLKNTLLKDFENMCQCIRPNVISYPYLVKAKRLMIDEFDSIKNIRFIYFDFYWGISSSIHNIMNPGTSKRNNRNHLDWKSNNTICTATIDLGIRCADTRRMVLQFNTAMIFNLIIKNEPDIIKQSIQLPQPNEKIQYYMPKNTSSVLKGIIPIKVLEMIECGDEKKAIQMMSFEHINDEDKLIECFLKEYNEKINIIQQNYNYEIQNPTINQKQKDNLTKNKDKSIKELNDKKEMIIERMKETTCRICYCDIEKKASVSCCQCNFCFTCIVSWLSNSKRCPNCSRIINQEDIYIISNETNKPKENIAPSNYQLFKKFIKNNTSTLSQYRIIVFIPSKDVAKSIQTKVLSKYSIPSRILSGSGASIQKTIDMLKKNEINIVFADPYVYSAGLNLEFSTHILFFNEFTRDTEMQCIGRCQRLGRESPLHIIKFRPLNEE